MKATNSAMVFEEPHVTSQEKLLSLSDKGTMENPMDHYEEPSYFFRGAIFGFILCIPFWAAIFWFII